MRYSVTFTKQALKDLEKISNPFYSNIKLAIENLAENPRPHGYKKLKSRNAFRIRVGSYRIIYQIFDDVLLVDVVNLGHRKDIYD